MAIPASKVRAICTASEAALVRASRKSELDKLSQAEVEKLLGQARKLFGKWRDLGRDQARARSQKTGFGEKAANTKLKVELFGETVTRLEARLAKLDKSAGAKSLKPTKKDRTVEHRATRAAVRKGMTAAGDLENESKFQKRAAKAESPTKTPAAKPAKRKAAAKSASAKAADKATLTAGLSAVELVEAQAKLSPIPTTPHSSMGLLNPAKQRKAVTAAKQSRVLRSGKTTRTLAHVKSRGKRNQARRDAKN